MRDAVSPASASTQPGYFEPVTNKTKEKELNRMSLAKKSTQNRDQQNVIMRMKFSLGKKFTKNFKNYKT